LLRTDAEKVLTQLATPVDGAALRAAEDLRRKLRRVRHMLDDAEEVYADYEEIQEDLDMPMTPEQAKAFTAKLNTIQAALAPAIKAWHAGEMTAAIEMQGKVRLAAAEMEIALENLETDQWFAQLKEAAQANAQDQQVTASLKAMEDQYARVKKVSAEIGKTIIALVTVEVQMEALELKAEKLEELLDLLEEQAEVTMEQFEGAADALEEQLEMFEDEDEEDEEDEDDDDDVEEGAGAAPAGEGDAIF
jgi:RNA polymerase primary sigma factor